MLVLVYVYVRGEDLIIMSKLNNLIGFWNSKSAEQEDKQVLSPRPSRPKSEIIDRNFVKRMENLSGGQRGPRERGGVRFILRRAPLPSHLSQLIGKIKSPWEQITHRFYSSTLLLPMKFNSSLLVVVM